MPPFRRAAAIALAVLSTLALAAPVAAVGTLDQSQTTFTNIDDPTGTEFLAMTFTAGLSGQLDQVDVLLLRQGDPADLTVEIWTVSGGEPASPLAGASATVTAADVPLGPHTWVSVPISAASVAGTEYAIVLSAPGAGPCFVDTPVCWAWAYDGSTDNLYADGQYHYSADGGATWAPEVYDFAFKTYVTIADADADDDGVADADDLCAGTVLPESDPVKWTKNRYSANAAGDFVDVKGKDSGLSVADTGGCSGDQIIAAAGLGAGHAKSGISLSALNAWIASH